jgi:hypothetical protein
MWFRHHRIAAGTAASTFLAIRFLRSAAVSMATSSCNAFAVIPSRVD